MKGMRILSTVVVAVAALHGIAQADETVATVNGAYPLWEYTGEMYARGHAQVGYQHAQLGLGRVQVETQPFLDIYGILNGEIKVGLTASERTRSALVLGYYDVPTTVESMPLGNSPVASMPLYAHLKLLPASIAGTAEIGSRLRAHANAMVLGQWADDARARGISAGASTMIEYRVFEHWAGMMHLGAEGLGQAERAHAGASLAYRLPYLDLRAGYARRFERTEQPASVVLVDGALIF
jgi:hypothetical protein